MADQNDGPFLQNVDRASALAIARLQLRENEQYSATMRGFRRGQRGETDEELALRLDREYLQQQITGLLRQQAANVARGNEGLETVRETTGGRQEAVLVNVVAAISLSNGKSLDPQSTVFQFPVTAANANENEQPARTWPQLEVQNLPQPQRSMHHLHQQLQYTKIQSRLLKLPALKITQRKMAFSVLVVSTALYARTLSKHHAAMVTAENAFKSSSPCL